MKFRSSRWFLILVLFQGVLALNCGQNQTFNLVQPNGSNHSFRNGFPGHGRRGNRPDAAIDRQCGGDHQQGRHMDHLQFQRQCRDG